MHIPPLLLLTLLLTPVLSCLRYAATFPWDTSLPFLATITDNNIVTCSINQTYDSHMLMQSTTDIQPDGTWYFKPWTFKCINSSFEARAEIGVRIVWYRAYNKDWRFIVNEVEDIAGEKWEYRRSLWCPEDVKKGVGEEKGVVKQMEVKKVKAKGHGIVGGKREGLKESATGKEKREFEWEG